MQSLEQMFERIINNGLTPKQLQHLNNIRGINMTPKYGYYASQQAPNGTHDLIIIDIDGTIVDSIPEALFNVPYRSFMSAYGGKVNYADGESIFAVSETEIDSDDCNIVGYIGDNTSDVWHRYIAVSPVQTIDDILTKLEQIIK